ncbi:unnamed protein product [Phyllotreta striolata]|uniref:ABC-type xenobiotic transporter n=1 Tax=Phyllotreta striolata TaxID=444603 RepID=A0A9N9XLH8_PHYSR|nr:unnamed protein product [Phyllotreta striolata]
MTAVEWNWIPFCGEEFVIWSPSQHDFGICFQNTFLHIPILAIFGISSAYYFGLQTGIVLRTRRQTFAIITRSIVSLILAFFPLVEFCNVYFYGDALDKASLMLVAVQGVCWFSHFFYTLRLKRGLTKNPRGPMLMTIIWLIIFSLSVLTARSYYLIYKHNSSERKFRNESFLYSCVNLGLLLVYGMSLIPSESSEVNARSISSENDPLLGSNSHTYVRFSGVEDSQYIGVAMENASLTSRLFFSWVNALIKKGANDGLVSSDDLYDLPPSLSTSYNGNKLEHQLNETPSSKYLFLKALYKCYAWEFFSVGILKLIADCSGFAGPILLNRLVSFIENKSEATEWGYVYALALIGSTTLAALCDTHFNFLMTIVGLKMRGALITTIYRKILSVNSMVLNSNLSVGEILNFMSTDTDRIVNSCPSFHSLWSIPFQIAVTLYLLYQQVGLAFLAGLAFSVILIPINKLIANKIGELSAKMMEQKDARVKLTSEVLSGYKPIKLYVWERHFISLITRKRDVELKYLKSRKYLDALCVYFWATTPVIISILTIGSYVLLGNELNAAIVFTTIALLNMLVSPLNAFPWVLNGLTEAWVSVKRIQKLLDLPNIDYSEIYDEIKEDNVEISISNGTFQWDFGKGKEFKLTDINATVNKGEFIGVIGPVGSGKSSLLAAILGELSRESGSISIKHIDTGFAFASQQTWLRRGTIRDNILFGQPFEETKYKSIIAACGLEEDLLELGDGDMTKVGDGAGTLSGGQKARIALARAVYQDKSVYLLDDVFSAVDVKVGKLIFNRCVMGLLKEKTRVLCTHNLQYLSKADRIVVMESGRIKEIETTGNVSGIRDSVAFDSELEVPVVNESSVARSGEEGEDLYKEVSKKGSVELKVCVSYWKSMGHFVSVSILVAMALMQSTRNITDWWLANEVTIQDNATNNSLEDFDAYLFTHKDDTKKFLLVYLGFAVANTLFTLIRAFVFAYGGIVAAKAIHKKLLKTVLKSKCAFFDVTPLGRIINRFSSDTYTIDDSLPFTLNILLAQLFGLLGSLTITVYGLPWICVILVPLIPIYTWLLNQYRVTSRELKRISSVTLSPLYNHFDETLRGSTTVRAMRKSGRFRAENDEHAESNVKALLAGQAAARWLGLRLQFISVAIVAGVSVAAAVQHQYDVADPGFIGLAVSYALSITGSLAGVVNAFTETEREMIAVERANQYFDNVTPERTLYAMEPPFAWPGQGVVAFVDVTMRYRSELRPSLKNVTFETRPSEKIGVVGRTGAGKSSLIAALFRLVELSEGSVSVDSVDVKLLSLDALRSRMFCIPQEPFLFGGTLKENLDPLGEFTDNEIWSAVRKANLYDTVAASGGLDCASGGLSSGERQLVCLARAVLRNPKVVCIDEATANVDEETDRIIQGALRTAFRNSTVLTIAHRIRTVFDSDRVIVMDQGEIVEFDEPGVLMANPDSYFYKLVKNVS